ncbi:hypothetical protein PSCICN_26870 [Pseudomonas cichorii]|nr:hypothetical protein PSCICN_26870 [Pseudomonas cichorii]
MGHHSNSYARTIILRMPAMAWNIGKQKPIDIHAQHWTEYKVVPTKPDDAAPKIWGCVFAKSCNLPDGEIDHKNPAGFVPVEKLADYGLWAVFGTGAAITAEGPTQTDGWIRWSLVP